MIPRDLRYSKEHEWVKVEGDEAVIGITDYAQEQLGDVVYVELPPVDSSRAVQDLWRSRVGEGGLRPLRAPQWGGVGHQSGPGKVPEKVNEEPYGAGWMVKCAD